MVSEKTHLYKLIFHYIRVGNHHQNITAGELVVLELAMNML